ncbi:hypothetical protein BVI2075_960019 [Burkholderia vietnamiensis]|nr:hypothetical protein BVI2075_960019 [Burkholderia vietnamiensis]
MTYSDPKSEALLLLSYSSFAPKVTFSDLRPCPSYDFFRPAAIDSPTMSRPRHRTGRPSSRQR